MRPERTNQRKIVVDNVFERVSVENHLISSKRVVRVNGGPLKK